MLGGKNRRALNHQVIKKSDFIRYIFTNNFDVEPSFVFYLWWIDQPATLTYESASKSLF